MTTITTKNFKRKLSAVITSTKAMRVNVQLLIDFGLEQYRDHGNASYLSAILNQCIGVKALPTITLKDYIKEHANLRWVKLKDGSHGFKKDGKEVAVTMPTVVWYEWEGGGHNDVKADMKIATRIKSLLTQLRTNLGDGKVDDLELARKAEKALAELVA